MNWRQKGDALIFERFYYVVVSDGTTMYQNYFLPVILLPQTRKKLVMDMLFPIKWVVLGFVQLYVI